MPILPEREIYGVTNMSTKCEILILDKDQKYGDLKLFHYHDGYPDYMGKFLMTHVHPLLMNSNNWTAETLADYLVYHKEDDEFEITAGIHPDIEFQYIINIPKKTITGYKCHYTREYDFREEFSLVIYGEYDLKRYLPIDRRKVYA